ncbi:MAG: radical SAM protein [Coprococcus sp.]
MKNLPVLTEKELAPESLQSLFDSRDAISNAAIVIPCGLNELACPYQEETPADIVNYVLAAGIRNVTLTGGEPLLQKEIKELIHHLLKAGVRVEIETNGSVSLTDFCEERPVFTMDYKLPSSGCESQMILENMELLVSDDTVKFVTGSQEDLQKAMEVIRTYDLTNRCHVYFSPVFRFYRAGTDCKFYAGASVK